MTKISFSMESVPSKLQQQKEKSKRSLKIAKNSSKCKMSREWDS